MGNGTRPGARTLHIVCRMTEVSLDDGIVALRPWRADDAEAIVACIDGDPEISRWLDVVPQPYTLEDARTYITGLGEQAFAITDAATGIVLGSIGVRWNETRDVGDITEVALSGSGTVIIVPGEANRVIVTADDNVVPLIESKTEGNKLTLSTKSGYAINEKIPITYTVFVKKLEKVSLSGSGNISGEGLAGEPRLHRTPRPHEEAAPRPRVCRCWSAR